MLIRCSYVLKGMESLKTGYLQIAFSPKFSPRNPLNSLSVCKWPVVLPQYPTMVYPWPCSQWFNTRKLGNWELGRGEDLQDFSWRREAGVAISSAGVLWFYSWNLSPRTLAKKKYQFLQEANWENSLGQWFPNWWVTTHQGNQKGPLPFKRNDPEVGINMIAPAAWLGRVFFLNLPGGSLCLSGRSGEFVAPTPAALLQAWKCCQIGKKNPLLAFFPKQEVGFFPPCISGF